MLYLARRQRRSVLRLLRRRGPGSTGLENNKSSPEFLVGGADPFGKIDRPTLCTTLCTFGRAALLAASRILGMSAEKGCPTSFDRTRRAGMIGDDRLVRCIPDKGESGMYESPCVGGTNSDV